MKTRTKEPVFKYKNGRRAAVVLDINVDRAMLERLEDVHDVKEVTRRRKTSPDARPLAQVVKELGLK